MWKQERIWIRRNEHDVIIGMSERVPPEVQGKIDARWNAAVSNARAMARRYPSAMGIANMLAQYERGARTEFLLNELESLGG